MTSKSKRNFYDDLLEDLLWVRQKRPKRWKVLEGHFSSKAAHAAAGIGFFRKVKRNKKTKLEVLVGLDVEGKIFKLPGGKAEKGEDPWTTARREVREETGTSILPASWSGEVCLRSFYYKPSHYTLFLWFLPSKSKLYKRIRHPSLDPRDKGELTSLEWKAIDDPFLPDWIRLMFGSKTLQTFFRQEFLAI